MTTPAAHLADQLGVCEGDIVAVAATIADLPADQLLPGWLCNEVRDVLDPHCARTVPELYGQTSPQWRDDNDL